MHADARRARLLCIYLTARIQTDAARHLYGFSRVAELKKTVDELLGPLVSDADIDMNAAAMADLSPRELLIMVPIAVAVLWMGVYPECFIAPIRADIAHLDARLAQAKPTGDAALTLGRPAPHAEAHQ